MKGLFGYHEKLSLRQRLGQVAAVLAFYAALITGAVVSGHGPDFDLPHKNTAPPAAESVQPSHNEHFFDTLQPQGYHGESYEWGAMANQVGEPYATAELLELIDKARGNGLQVNVHGDPASSDWGISDVTVRLPDGGYKSYSDTPHKLAILQWYATR